MIENLSKKALLQTFLCPLVLTTKNMKEKRSMSRNPPYKKKQIEFRQWPIPKFDDLASR